MCFDDLVQSATVGTNGTVIATGLPKCAIPGYRRTTLVSPDTSSRFRIAINSDGNIVAHYSGGVVDVN